jgi:DivIVA domain-containing protein
VPSLAQPRGTTAEPLTAGDVRAAHFAVVLGGYDMAEVDAVLRQVARLLPERTPWEADPEPPAAGPGPALRGALRGYARDDVDDFLVRCAHSLRSRVRELPELAPLTARPRTGEPLTPREVETVQFSMVLRGYAPDAVDDLLDRVRALLRG